MKTKNLEIAQDKALEKPLKPRLRLRLAGRGLICGNFARRVHGFPPVGKKLRYGVCLTSRGSSVVNTDPFTSVVGFQDRRPSCGKTFWRAGSNYNFSPEPSPRDQIMGLAKFCGQQLGEIRIWRLHFCGQLKCTVFQTLSGQKLLTCGVNIGRLPLDDFTTLVLDPF